MHIWLRIGPGPQSLAHAWMDFTRPMILHRGLQRKKDTQRAPRCCNERSCSVLQFTSVVRRLLIEDMHYGIHTTSTLKINWNPRSRISPIPPLLLESIFPAPRPFSQLSLISCFHVIWTPISRHLRVPKMIPFVVPFLSRCWPQNGLQDGPKTTPRPTK